MNDISPPSTPFRITRWLVSTVFTGSVIGGAIAGVAVLMVMQKFDHDPAIPAEDQTASTTHDAELERRLQHLEARMAKQHAAAENNDVSGFQQDVARTGQQVEELKKRIDAMQNGTSQESRMAQIALGMTQLKSAFENDMSLQPGIDLLKKSVQDVSVEKTLNDLTALAQSNLPTKEDILKKVRELQQPQTPQTPTPQDNAQNNSGTWQQRMKSALGQTMKQLVKVEPTADTQKQTTLSAIQDAVGADNYALATLLAEKLPGSAQAEQLLTALRNRNQAQQLVQKAVGQLSQSVGNATTNQSQTKGSLY